MKTINKTPMWTLAIVFAIYTASAFADKMYLTSNVNVRADATAESMKLGELKINDSVEATATIKDGFRLVTFNGVPAYIKDSYLTATAPPEYILGCVGSLLPNSNANKKSETRKKVIASMVKYLGVSDILDVVGHVWGSTNGDGTAFKLADDGELVMSVVDLPRKDWNRLLKNAQDSTFLFGGMIKLSDVQGAVRAGQFTGQICLEKDGDGYKITAALDGVINKQSYNGNRITLRPAAGGNITVNGIFAGESINGTFSAR